MYISFTDMLVYSSWIGLQSACYFLPNVLGEGLVFQEEKLEFIYCVLGIVNSVCNTLWF